MIELCKTCGGLYATENMEMFAGTPCKCLLPSARGSVARPITGDDLWEIHDLAQRVIQSRQNVGTAMKDQARKIVGIVQRLNSNQPPNDRDQRREHAAADARKTPTT